MPGGMHWDSFTCTLYKHCLEGLNIFFHRAKLCLCVYRFHACMGEGVVKVVVVVVKISISFQSCGIVILYPFAILFFNILVHTACSPYKFGTDPSVKDELQTSLLPCQM